MQVQVLSGAPIKKGFTLKNFFDKIFKSLKWYFSGKTTDFGPPVDSECAQTKKMKDALNYVVGACEEALQEIEDCGGITDFYRDSYFEEILEEAKKGLGI